LRGEMWKGRSKCRRVSPVSRILGCRWDSWVQEMEDREVLFVQYKSEQWKMGRIVAPTGSTRSITSEIVACEVDRTKRKD
jgi:hypothetical protein